MEIRVASILHVNATRRLILTDARISARMRRERNIKCGTRGENANFLTLSFARVYDAHNAAIAPINVRRAFRILRNTLHYS